MKESGESLGTIFFRQSPQECARKLIGCRLASGECAGVIVETEAYAAEGDEACHTFFRPSARQFLSDHAEGTTYVYLNYGIHWLLNFVVKGSNGDGFVLIRALSPIKGLRQMRRRRGRKRQAELCSGPGKLTQALGISGEMHGMSLTPRSDISLSWGPDSEVPPPVACRRVGISREIERKWRFVRAGSRCVSVRPGSE